VILYLHGFRSRPSPGRPPVGSAEAMGCARDARRFLCPQLPASPRAAAQLIEAAARLEDPQQAGAHRLVAWRLLRDLVAEQIGCRARAAPTRRIKALRGPARPPRNAAGVLFGTDHRGEAGITWTSLRTLDTPSITRARRYFLLATRPATR